MLGPQEQKRRADTRFLQTFDRPPFLANRNRKYYEIRVIILRIFLQKQTPLVASHWNTPTKPRDTQVVDASDKEDKPNHAMIGATHPLRQTCAAKTVQHGLGDAIRRHEKQNNISR